MELTDAVRRRHMVRSFSTRPLEAAVLEPVLDLATRAPSAGDTQGADLVVLTREEARARFWAHASSPEWRARGRQAPGITAAPAIVLVVSDPDAYARRYAAPDKVTSPLAGRDVREWPIPYWAVDAGSHILLLLLAAVERGLGALFFHVRGDNSALLAEFGIPSHKVLIGAVALGYPATDAARTPRRRRGRGPGELVHKEHW